MGSEGEKAIKTMFKMGQEKGILPLILRLSFA